MSQENELHVGCHVKSLYDGHEGIVVKIIKGTDIENHGTVYVWQMNRYEYGADNCEHCCEFGWQKSLKVLKSAK